MQNASKSICLVLFHLENNGLKYPLTTFSPTFTMAPTPVIPNTQQKQPKGGKGYVGPQFQRVLSVSLGKAYGGDVYSERELFILATETKKEKGTTHM